MRRPAARDPPYTVDPPSTSRRLPRRDPPIREERLTGARHPALTTVSLT